MRAAGGGRSVRHICGAVTIALGLVVAISVPSRSVQPVVAAAPSLRAPRGPGVISSLANGIASGPGLSVAQSASVLAFLPNGDLLVGDGSNGVVRRVDSTGLESVLIGGGSSFAVVPSPSDLNLNGVSGVATNASGDVVVSGTGRVIVLPSTSVMRYGRPLVAGQPSAISIGSTPRDQDGATMFAREPAAGRPRRSSSCYSLRLKCLAGLSIAHPAWRWC
jgi:hypothetical protein